MIEIVSVGPPGEYLSAYYPTITGWPVEVRDVLDIRCHRILTDYTSPEENVPGGESRHQEWWLYGYCYGAADHICRDYRPGCVDQ